MTLLVTLAVVIVGLEAAQLGVAVWAQLHRRANKNPFGPLG